MSSAHAAARPARVDWGHYVRMTLFVSMLLVGLGIMLYPAFTRLVFLYKSVRQADAYDQALMEIPDDSLELEWRMAREYNEARQYNLFHEQNEIVDPFDGSPETEALNQEYTRLVNPLGSGVMGYLDIPKINQRLNIFHGTDAKSLVQGVGHVQGTSLPVGGASSHCVLSAHRGLPTAKLFTDLDRLEVGDQFYLHVLNHDMAYEVDDIKVVLPSEIGALDIVKGADLVTLVTCTPYSVNTHRLLVRGHAVPYVPQESLVTRALHWLNPWRLVAAALVLVVALVALVVVRLRRRHTT